jgi:hypothetical protein
MSTFEQRVEQHHVIEFQSAVELTLQQMGPKLRPLINEQTCTGEQNALIRLFDRVEASQRTGRKPENVDNRANRRRRWLIYDDPWETGEYVDEVDVWRQAFDPTSNLLQTHAAAIGRRVDQIILEGLRGAAYEGKRGETAVALPAAQKVGIQVGSGTTPADVGLNVKKLRAARTRLAKGHVDLDREEVFLALSADEHDALFDFVEATSADYQNWDSAQRPAFKDGKLTRFMGFTFVPFEELPENAGNTIRYCMAWVKSAATLGIWSDIRTRMWNDSSRQQTPVFCIDFAGDCRRTQDARVVEIACLKPT